MKKKAVKGFKFGSSKPKEKKRKTGLTEEILSEDNPQWSELMRANDLARQRKEVEKQKAKAKDHAEIHTYLAIVFQSREQKLEFMKNFPSVLCVDEVFIDGESFSAAVGFPVTPNELPVTKTPVSARLKKLAENY